MLSMIEWNLKERIICTREIRSKMDLSHVNSICQNGNSPEINYIHRTLQKGSAIATYIPKPIDAALSVTNFTLQYLVVASNR